ncbi:hypothetical protein ACFO9E_18265 [Streptomyces maoxianensis]|uniref:Uncharacterized protein n=1 Tax=Streptomyces maoxianensis TaxID=1459942 RepID=A0ABV9GAV2_9ACTN
MSTRASVRPEVAMTNTPPPMPDYPPSAGAWQAPDVTVVVQTEVMPEPSRWDFTWLQLGRNSMAVVVSVVTAPVWAESLIAVREDQHVAGAWFMAGAAFCVALWLDHSRRRFLTRVLVWTTALGAIGALPVISELVHLLTGSRS